MKNFTNILPLIVLGVILISLIDYCGFIVGSILTILIILMYILTIVIIKSEKLKKIRNQLPYTKISLLKEGLVKIKGTAVYVDPLYSKLKEKKCIGYHLKTETFKRKSKNFRGRYSTDSNQFICQPFLLKDDTGEVTISVEDITVFALSKPKVKFKDGKKYTEELFKNNTEVEIIGHFSENTIIKAIEKNIFIVSKLKQ
ncbi:hypothetical protein [Olleya sp. HaHaR_3_96]|uniref:hypothetical protein n=1 Tax=Olleya sp. HaHaR_3_96 TaxID=2745560 RepID=UPI001C4F2331|nr:hypothetical protein [Olleya sp. HaHaR_3_96]QXP60851.1 hypothetical protein H0I26_04225 [Olleya sp. HaHaR_3_96]